MPPIISIPSEESVLLGEFAPLPEFAPGIWRLSFASRRTAAFRRGHRGMRRRWQSCLLRLAKGQASISVIVEVVDEEQVLALTAVVEWFVARR